MKIKFLKNFFYLLSMIFSYSFLALIIITVTVVFHGGEYVRPMLLTFAGITLLYCGIVFSYCISTVKFDDEGIKLMRFGKVQRAISWCDVYEVKKTTEYNNPAYTLYNKNGEVLISVDRRKPIGKVIWYYMFKISSSVN